MTTLSKNFFSYAGNKKYNKRIVEFGDTNFRSKILSTFIFENNFINRIEHELAKFQIRWKELEVRDSL